MASTELSLECKVQSYSMLLKCSFGEQHPPPADPIYDKLQEFVSRLEEERLKIDVFKRELPLCMQLLTNAVETSRRQLQACKTIQAAAPTKPVLEEFMPPKNSTPAEDQKPPTVSDKANWMTSVQLWSQASDVAKQQSTVNESPKEDSIFSETCNQIISSGAFLPFNKERNSCQSLGLAAEKGVTEMELLEKAPEKNGICSSGRENSSDKSGNDGGVVMAMEERVENVGADLGATQTTSCTTSSNTNTTTQTHRKARRCWSPDLHRRFVSALQMLGGSQVATPKQIRELMKVDGLTNDEVKSHLQKYRLHTRRPGPTPQPSGAPAPQLVVLGLGGLWVQPEYAAAAAAAQSGAPALYGPPTTSHPPSHFYTPSALPQEFYTRTPPQHLQHQVQLYNKAATPQTTQSSPESEVRGTGERSESFEEEKSGSSSWRVEGGENGDERNGKVSCGKRPEEGEERNRSDITLKF